MVHAAGMSGGGGCDDDDDVCMHVNTNNKTFSSCVGTSIYHLYIGAVDYEQFYSKVTT